MRKARRMSRLIVASIRMHTNLRAWRKYRRLSQERVGNILKVTHTTVGRWESGRVPLTTEDLANLARIYGATIGQLLAPPEMAAMVSKLERAQQVLQAFDTDGGEQWLALGEKASGSKK